MKYRDLTDEDIYKMAGERWDALSQKKRTSAKSIEICEDLFILREMERHAEAIESTAHLTTRKGTPRKKKSKD